MWVGVVGVWVRVVVDGCSRVVRVWMGESGVRGVDGCGCV